MAADVFETYVVSLIGAMIVGKLTCGTGSSAILLPIILGGISVIGAILGILFVNMAKGKNITIVLMGVWWLLPLPLRLSIFRLSSISLMVATNTLQ